MKLLNLITLTIYLASFSVYSQTEEKSPKKEKKEQKFNEEESRVFRIGVNLTPQFFLFNKASMENVKSDYKYAYNMDFSLVFTAKFGKIIEAKTGLGYSSKNFNREEACLICGNDIVQESNFKIGYIEIPLLANIYFYNSRLDAYGILGIKNSFLVKAKNKHKDNIQQDVETVFNVKENFAKYLLGLQAGLGINYNLTYSLSLTAEFIYNYNPLIFEIPTGLNFHSLGVNVGLNFKL